MRTKLVTSSINIMGMASSRGSQNASSKNKKLKIKSKTQEHINDNDSHSTSFDIESTEMENKSISNEQRIFEIKQRSS